MNGRFAGLLLVYACAVGGTALATSRERPLEVVAWLCFAFVPYLLMVLRPAVPDFPTLRVSLVVAAVGGLAWVTLPPLLSDDVYRFVWEGHLWWHGVNPYELAPSDPSLAAMRDDVWERINNRDLTTTYPPVAQLFFALGAVAGGSVVAAKCVALLLHLVSVVFLARATGTHGTTAPLALALNPLALSEAALNGHLDVAVGTLLLAAALAIRGNRYAKAAMHIIVATGLKVVGVVLLPTLWRRRVRAGAVATLGSFAMLAPLVWQATRDDAIQGSTEFARRWRGNDLFYGWVEWAAAIVTPEPETASLVARITVVACVVVLALWLALREASALRSARAIVWAVLLLSPQVHPWYVLWLLPLEIASRRVAAVCWSFGVLLSYVAVSGWLAHRVWLQPAWTYIVEYGLLFAVLASERLAPRDFFDAVGSET